MRLSIITINYNNCKGLVRTLESVYSQNISRDYIKTDFEHIIVDGGSDDGSYEIIKEYVEKVGFSVKWVSEIDSGIYNAMNKGTMMSSGDYLLFLNSGDILADNLIIDKLSSMQLTAEVVIGGINIVSNEKIISCYSLYGKEIGLFGLLLRGIPHQGTLISRILQKKYPYDEKYKINSDFKFFIETIILQNCSVQYIPLIISNYDNGGISAINSQLQIKERYEIFRKMIPPRISMEYEFWIPNYYELIRIKWLLKHPFFYRVYRVWTTIGRIMLG